ncbi:MAG: hypothetical protein IPI60_10010 [Saprospiraceae bacterium]|nr:hypothetical protein [Saprospiraceae bacterium]
MKNLLFILICIPLIAFSQKETQPDLYEVINIHVKKGQVDAFEAAVKAHNAKFHPKDGQYHARLFSNLNGPNGGTYAWIMGPTSWTAMDNRPSKGDHDTDWAKVEALVEKFESPSYWKFSHELSQVIDNISPPKRLIWMYDIKRGQTARWSGLVEKVKKVYEVKRPTEPFWVTLNEFSDTGAGMDASIIFAFDNWSWMDRKSNFAKDFEEVHGEGTWHNFMNEFNDTIEGRVDWLRNRID